MMQARRLISAVLLSVSGACSFSASVVLLNNTQDDIDVTIREAGGDRHVSGKLKAGTDQHLSSSGTSGGGWEVEIASANCVWTYAVPVARPSSYPEYRDVAGTSPREASYVRVQFEQDRRIYLVPPYTKEPADVTLLSDYQVDGFPLQPATVLCTDQNTLPLPASN